MRAWMPTQTTSACFARPPSQAARDARAGCFSFTFQLPASTRTRCGSSDAASRPCKRRAWG
jgi:hypothetical protein